MALKGEYTEQEAGLKFYEWFGLNPNRKLLLFFFKDILATKKLEQRYLDNDITQFLKKTNFKEKLIEYQELEKFDIKLEGKIQEMYFIIDGFFYKA